MNNSLTKIVKVTYILLSFILLLSFQSCKGQKDKDKDKEKDKGKGKSSQEINDAASVLHSFNGTDGDTPKGSLTLVNGTLYGYTSGGGTGNKGVIFKIDTTGNNFAVLYSFLDGPDNGLGNEPHHDAMLYFNSALYGAACYGGSNNNGVIFKINLDGTGYSPVHIFKAGIDDGAQPHSGVMAIGNILYGATAEGGKEGRGVIFKMNPDGTDFSVLYSFKKSTGHNPHCRLTLGSDGETVFGTTKSGGAGGVGVVFGYNLSNSNFSVIHNFVKSPDDGYTVEHGFVTRSNNTLFGMTHFGGSNNKGVVYAVNEDSSNFRLIHSFGSDSKDGASPYGSVQLSNGFLYGTTQEGGKDNRGTIFRISTDGTKYETIFSYDKPTTGEYPIDNVIFNNEGTMLYTYGQEGGANAQTGAKKFGTIIKLIISR